MVYWAVFLSAIFVAVSGLGQQLLGAEKCTWGPAYWCASIENANECEGSIKHCQDHVWIGDHELAPKTNCALCELIVKEVFEKMGDNATEEQVVDRICDIVPSRYKESCETYGKEFYEEFLKDSDPHTFCLMMGFCSQEFLRIMEEGHVLTAILAQKPQDISCDTCTALMAFLQKEFLAKTKEIEAMLDQGCAVLPVDQDECNAAVNELFETALSYFENYKPDELCQMVGLCESNLADTLLGVGPVKFGLEGQTDEAAKNMVF